jgi:hypothetical protein
MLDFLLELLSQLKDLPGFRFVEPYYYSLYEKVQSVQDKRGDMEDQVVGFKKGLEIVKRAPSTYKGSKKKK